MFHVYTGNNLERLAAALADLLSTPLSSSLEEEVVIIQSSGMERWVSMEIARAHGVCANIGFYYPNAFIDKVFSQVIRNPETTPPADRSVYDPKVMTWRVMGLLSRCINLPGFETLNSYLQEKGESLKRYQLAQKIAQTFDRYVLFRPDKIFKWEDGDENQWQAVLWRELVKSNKSKHRSALFKTFLELEKKGRISSEGMPERISVFGISALPRFHMEVLAAFAGHTQVNLFLMNPCRQFWGDILSDREIKRTVTRKQSEKIEKQDLYLEKGNSLLSSMGMLGRDFFDLVYEYDFSETRLFEAPSAKSLLFSIQSDLLNLKDRGAILDPLHKVEKESIHLNDDSIQIHSCHSPMRETEILYDNFLNLFEKEPHLKPSDILVMAPDINVYAPYVRAVFDHPVDDHAGIPFSVADQAMISESRVIEVFLLILDIAGSRFNVPQVLAVVESPAVMKKFDFSDADMVRITQWVDDVSIRWGIDKHSRKELGLPEFEENTWKAGLKRLALGYALPGGGRSMFEGILPYDAVEGGESEVLGRFLEFMDRLSITAATLDRVRPLERWGDTLTTILETFFETDAISSGRSTENETREIQAIRNVINDLVAMQQSDLGNFTEHVDIRVVKAYLKDRFEKGGFGFGFMSGGVTFCSLLPMRSIPFKIVCLLGMNNDCYPRQGKDLGFDLITKHPRPGDRSVRDEDRYLFLEAIVCTREKLYISYVGQSVVDNGFLPPSVLVSELTDYIQSGFKVPGEDITDHIIIKHPLQPFSPAYFKGDDRLFSYSMENFQAAQSLNEQRTPPGSFITQPLEPPEEQFKTVKLFDLYLFFSNPARYLLQKRLGITYDQNQSMVEENEPFLIEGLYRYKLEQRLLENLLTEADVGVDFDLTRAAGELPHGNMGECVFNNVDKDVRQFAENLFPYVQEPQLAPLEIDLELTGFRLTGRIDSIYPQNHLIYRLAVINSKDFLKAWICHLALGCMEVGGYPEQSLLVGLKERSKVWSAWAFGEVEHCRDLLSDLLTAYWKGLSHPLCFFPESSFSYVTQVIEKNVAPDKALVRAKEIWVGNDYRKGEGMDQYINRCFRHTDPMDPEFEKVAMDIYEPMLLNRKKLM